LSKISHQDVHVRTFWLNIIRAHNVKTRKFVYQEETALNVLNGVDSSNVVTSHLVPACVKELSLLSCGSVGQNANYTFIHCTWLELKQTCLIICNSFVLLVESPYNVCVRNFGLIERTVRIGDRLCSAKKCVEVIVNASKSNRVPVKEVSTQDVWNLESTVTKILPKGLSLSCKEKPT